MDGRRHRGKAVVQRCPRRLGEAPGHHPGQVVRRPLDPAAQRHPVGCDAPAVQQSASDQSAPGVGPLVLRPTPRLPEQLDRQVLGRRRSCTSASHPSRPAAVSAATCPSPRCSRRHVHQYQRAATGSSGGPVARVAANSGRPASGTPSRSACNPGTRVRAVLTTSGTTRPERLGRGMGPRGPGVGRRGDRPRIGQRPTGPVGMEVEERCSHRFGSDRSVRCRPTGEVAHPESPEPEGVHGGEALGVEVDDGVDRLEGQPPVAGRRYRHAAGRRQLSRTRWRRPRSVPARPHRWVGLPASDAGRRRGPRASPRTG